MRIKKQNSNSKIQSSQSDIQHKQTVNAAQSNNAISEAIDYIHSAINSLADVAKEDKVAKESIANLSVVLLDLTTGVSSMETRQREKLATELEAQLIDEIEHAGIDLLDKDKVLTELTGNFGYTAEEAEQLYQRMIEYNK